jgi:putative membrane protein
MYAVELALLFGRGRPGVFLFGLLIPLAIIALVAYGIWELSRSRTTTPATAAPSGSARAVLDERFARGDIDAEEYVQRRALLDGTAVVTPGPPATAGVAGPPPAAAPPPDASSSAAPATDVPTGSETSAAPGDPSSGPADG